MNLLVRDQDAHLTIVDINDLTMFLNANDWRFVTLEKVDIYSKSTENSKPAKERNLRSVSDPFFSLIAGSAADINKGANSE